jgi:hypothetical protein
MSQKFIKVFPREYKRVMGIVKAVPQARAAEVVRG